MKLHLGCGRDYKEGYHNVDFNKNVKADQYFDLNEKFPLEDNTYDEIFTEGAIEHIFENKRFQFMDECWRVCKPGAKIKILTNHFSSVWALQHLGHHSYFGVDSFSVMEGDCFNGEQYNKARFKIHKIKLYFFYPKMVNYGFLNKLPINGLFNFNRTWQRIMERFQFLGFDGIYYELEVLK